MVITIAFRLITDDLFETPQLLPSLWRFNNTPLRSWRRSNDDAAFQSSQAQREQQLPGRSLVVATAAGHLLVCATCACEGTEEAVRPKP